MPAATVGQATRRGPRPRSSPKKLSAAQCATRIVNSAHHQNIARWQQSRGVAQTSADHATSGDPA